MIKQEFWSSKTLVRVSRHSRLLFIGLWNFSDDYGIHENSNRMILGNIFPYDEEVNEKLIDTWKKELLREKLLVLIQYNGHEYLYCRSWKDHQKVPHPGKETVPEEVILESLMKLSGDSQSQIEREIEIEIESKKEKEIQIEGEMSKPPVPTPAQNMRSFVKMVEEKNDEYHSFIEALSENMNIVPAALAAEIDKFCAYWIELNPSGKKQRWELEKAFEVKRRLSTWFQNASKFSPAKKTNVGIV